MAWLCFPGTQVCWARLLRHQVYTSQWWHDWQNFLPKAAVSGKRWHGITWYHGTTWYQSYLHTCQCVSSWNFSATSHDHFLPRRLSAPEAQELWQISWTISTLPLWCAMRMAASSCPVMPYGIWLLLKWVWPFPGVEGNCIRMWRLRELCWVDAGRCEDDNFTVECLKSQTFRPTVSNGLLKLS